MLGSGTETSYSVIDYHITSNKKKLKVSMYNVNSRSIAIFITVMYDATHNPAWWLHRRKVVARRASTTQKDTATVDGERDTKFTKVVAMVTGMYHISFHYTPSSRGSKLRMAKLFYNYSTSVCHAQICTKAHRVCIVHVSSPPPLELDALRLLLRPF